MTGEAMKSANYSSGSTGWKTERSGDVEFNNMVVRRSERGKTRDLDRPKGEARERVWNIIEAMRAQVIQSERQARIYAAKAREARDLLAGGEFAPDRHVYIAADPECGDQSPQSLARAVLRAEARDASRDARIEGLRRSAMQAIAAAETKRALFGAMIRFHRRAKRLEQELNRPGGHT